MNSLIYKGGKKKSSIKDSCVTFEMGIHESGDDENLLKNSRKSQLSPLSRGPSASLRRHSRFSKLGNISNLV
jgi:hypothetical protein